MQTVENFWVDARSLLATPKTHLSSNRYLKLSPGRPSLSVLKMALEGLTVELRNAIGRAHAALEESLSES